MPSRKKNKGKARRAKAAAQTAGLEKECIFGSSAAASSAKDDLFAEPAAPSSKRQRTDEDDEDSGSESCGTDDGSDGAESGESLSFEQIMTRRKEQSEREILEQVTVSLNDYRGNKGGDLDELHADVRGIMRHHGLAIIRKALSDEEVNLISTMAESTRQRVCTALEAKNIPYDEPINDEAAICFRELAIRCQGRMDVRCCDETATNDESESGETQQLPPLELIDNLSQAIIHGAESPNRVYAGWIFSLPNSADQPWHQDGCPLFAEGTESLPIYALNVFCGLHDKQLLELGPTEFVVGSHRMAPERAMEGVGDAVSAVLGKGDVLLYDYRICHRGTSNLTAVADNEGAGAGIVRKVLYLMYARPWFKEHLNFGDKSLFG